MCTWLSGEHIDSTKNLNQNSKSFVLNGKGKLLDLIQVVYYYWNCNIKWKIIVPGAFRQRKQFQFRGNFRQGTPMMVPGAGNGFFNQMAPQFHPYQGFSQFRQPRSQFSGADKTCHRCGQLGHLIKDCPTRPKWKIKKLKLHLFIKAHAASSLSNKTVKFGKTVSFVGGLTYLSVIRFKIIFLFQYWAIC